MATSSAAAHYSSVTEASHGGHATTRASSPTHARSRRIASTQSHDESLQRSIFHHRRGSGSSDRRNTHHTVAADAALDVQRRPSTATGVRSSSSYKLFPSPRDSYSPHTSAASLQRETLINAVAELGRKRRSSSLEPRRRRTRSPSAAHLQHAAVSSIGVSAASADAAAAAAHAQESTTKGDQVTVVAHSYSLAPQLSLSSLSNHDSTSFISSSNPTPTTTDAAAPRGQPQNCVSTTNRNGDASAAGMLSITPMSTVLEAGDSPTVASLPVLANNANTSYIHAPFAPRPFLPASNTPSQSHSTSSSTVSAITAACESAAHGRPRTAPYESAAPSPVSPLFPRDQAFAEAMNNPPKPQYVWSSRHAAASQQTLHGLGLSMPLGPPPDSPLTPRTIHPPKMHEENPPPPPPKSPRWYGQWGRPEHSRDSSDNSISKISLKSDGTVLDAEFISPAKPTLFDLQMMPGYKASVADTNVAQKPKVTVITRSPAPEAGVPSGTSQSAAHNRKAVTSATYSPGDGSGDVLFPALQREEPQPTKRKHKPAPLQIHTKDTTVEPELLTSAIYTPNSAILGRDEMSKSDSPAPPIKPFASHAMPHSPGFPMSPSHALSGNPVGRPSVLQSRGNSALSNIITATRARSPSPEAASSTTNLAPPKDSSRTEKRGNAAEQQPSSTLARLREEARLKAEEASKTFSIEAGDYLQTVDRESRRPSARSAQSRGRSIEPALKSPTIKAAVDATDSLRDFANSMDSASINARPKAPPRTSTPDVWGDASTDNGPDPMDTLTTLGKQSEALHQRYSSLRSQRQKTTSDLSAALNNPKPGPDFHKILMDCHISLNTINSSMDICFAKLQSLDCRKEEAIHSLKLQTAAKVRLAEQHVRKGDSVSSIRSQVVQQSEAAVRTRASKESFQQPDSALTAIARASAGSLKPNEPPTVESRPRTSEGSRTDSPMRTSDTPKSSFSYDALESRATGARTSDPIVKPDIHPTARVDVDYPRVIRNVPDKAANMPPPVSKPSGDDASPRTTTGKRFVPRSKRRQLDIKVVGGPITDLPAAPGPAPASPLPEIPTSKDAATRKPVPSGSAKSTPSNSWTKSSALSQCMTNEQESSTKRPQRRSNSPPGTSGSSAPDEPPEARTPPRENKVLMGGKLPSLSSVQVYIDDDGVLPAFYGHPLLAREVRT